MGARNVDLSMDKEKIEELMKFHEDKANYYLEWYNDLVDEEHTIGFKYLETNKDN